MGCAVVAAAVSTLVWLPNGAATAAVVSTPSATSPYVHGPLSSPQGGFIYDQYGRVDILHGVNAV